MTKKQFTEIICKTFNLKGITPSSFVFVINCILIGRGLHKGFPRHMFDSNLIHFLKWSHKMEIHNLGKAPAPFGNKIHIMLIFLLQLILSCNPQKTNDGILSKEILYGEWALVDGEHQVNYPNIEFFADSSAILYSQADTIYRFTFFIRNDSLYLTDINGKKYVSRIRKLSSVY